MLLGNLPSIIYDQFLQIVEKASQNSCFQFNACDFSFNVFQQNSHTLMSVIYTVIDSCVNQKNIIAIIDITGICLDYLTSCKWIEYLTKIANQFVYDICPPFIRVVPQQYNYCRTPPPTSNLLPCKHEVHVIKTIEPVTPTVTTKTVTLAPSSCSPQCQIVPPCVTKTYVLRYQQQPSSGCCGQTTYAQPQSARHQFQEKLGSIDYNDHVWNKQCGTCTSGCSGVQAY
jgi:hypothetical protein